MVLQHIQLSLFTEDNPRKILSLATASDTKKSANHNFQKNTQPTINTYCPGKRNVKYYRLSYRSGTKTKHIHIPGGNINSKLVQWRARKIQGMIDHGVSLTTIITVILNYKNNSKI